MLPTSNTNRYGDLLVEFYRGIKNDNLSEARVDEIQREFNELWAVVQQKNDHPVINEPTITKPVWNTSPLHQFHVVFTVDAPITTGVETAVTFESSWGDANYFDFFQDDKSKILFSPGVLNFRLDGFVKWEADANGYRYARAYFYKTDGTLIGSQSLHGIASAGAATDTVGVIAYTDSLPIGFNDAAYMTLKVTQNSGGDLDLQSVRLSLGVA